MGADHRTAAARRRVAAAGLALAVAAQGCGELHPRLEAALAPDAPDLVFDRDIDLPPPQGLRVTSNLDREIGLAWDPILVGDVAGYVILRSREAAGSYGPAGRTSSRFATVWVDSGHEPGALGDGQTYHYRVHPYDSKGYVSRSHGFATATTAPAPEPPGGIRTYSNLPRRVVLRWEPAETPSVVGYQVLRGPTRAGPWERVAFVRGQLRTVYEDSVPGDLRVLYYRLRSVNRFAGESEMSEPVRAVTKAEPLPPVGLEVAERALGSIRLRWQRNVERDIVRYDVLRAVRGPGGWDPERLIAEVAPPDSGMRDSRVGCGQRVRYRLRAADADGLTSAPSQPLEVEAPGIGLGTRDGPDGPELFWDPAAAAGWTLASVYRQRSVRPDLLLGEGEPDAPFPLSGLPAGAHRLSVVLSRPQSPAGTGRPAARGPDSFETAPPCELAVNLSPARGAP